ncbi:MAG: hypothetical protein JNK29_19505 [Anaerolineales bacterium]|nr:hypothetical protein [Anaerolineales bacterium]
MTTAAWFYRAPEPRPYLIAERVRLSLWDQRLGTLWLDTVSAEPPITLAGTHAGQPVKLEWTPAEWLRLTGGADAGDVASALGTVLGRRPTLRYTDTAGQGVWEWWIKPDAAEQRWQAIQGQPAFGSPARLNPAR